MSSNTSAASMLSLADIGLAFSDALVQSALSGWDIELFENGGVSLSGSITNGGANGTMTMYIDASDHTQGNYVVTWEPDSSPYTHKFTVTVTDSTGTKNTTVHQYPRSRQPSASTSAKPKKPAALNSPWRRRGKRLGCACQRAKHSLAYTLGRALRSRVTCSRLDVATTNVDCRLGEEEKEFEKSRNCALVTRRAAKKPMCWTP